MGGHVNMRLDYLDCNCPTCREAVTPRRWIIWAVALVAAIALAALFTLGRYVLRG